MGRRRKSAQKVKMGKFRVKFLLTTYTKLDWVGTMMTKVSLAEVAMAILVIKLSLQ